VRTEATVLRIFNFFVNHPKNFKNLNLGSNRILFDSYMFYGKIIIPN
jgi:hypothetical protein